MWSNSKLKPTAGDFLRNLKLTSTHRRRNIVYSIDALIPGFYVWVGCWGMRIGGSVAESNYTGVIHSIAGVALVLPGYRIFTTYQGDYDP